MSLVKSIRVSIALADTAKVVENVDDQREQLLGAADIVVEKLKQGNVVHRRLSDVSGP